MVNVQKHFTPLDLPSPDIARERGWKYQVDWYDDEAACFIRVGSLGEALAYVDKYLINQTHYIRPIFYPNEYLRELYDLEAIIFRAREVLENEYK